MGMTQKGTSIVTPDAGSSSSKSAHVSELGYLYFHPRLYPAADAVEVHYVLGADTRVILCYAVQGISAFDHIDCI